MLIRATRVNIFFLGSSLILYHRMIEIKSISIANNINKVTKMNTVFNGDCVFYIRNRKKIAQFRAYQPNKRTFLKNRKTYL